MDGRFETVGLPVGCLVGVFVGLLVGDLVGTLVGARVGDLVGLLVGFLVGLGVGVVFNFAKTGPCCWNNRKLSIDAFPKIRPSLNVNTADE